jgi:hypothetical protein
MAQATQGCRDVDPNRENVLQATVDWFSETIRLKMQQLYSVVPRPER